MKLYDVSNGYIGNSGIHLIVIAKDEEGAIRLASEKFKADARNDSYEADLAKYAKYGWDTAKVEEYRYEPNYWKDLKVQLLCEDVSKPYVSELYD